MKEQKITIEIGPDGQITADADGFSGDACIKDIEKILADVAADWTEVDRKPEAGDARLVRRGRQTVGKGTKE